MATLVIHPEDDPSTSFLKQIYSKNAEWKIITPNIIKSELIAEIEKAEDLVVMGHGDINGLFATNNSSRYIIDSSFCSLLESKNCLLIWCNADEFVKKNKMSFNGIFTGMFVSQLNELIIMDSDFEFEENILDYQPMIDESNTAFASILGKLLKENSFDNLHSIYEKLKLDYKVFALTNEVANYNHSRIYYHNPK